MKKKTEIKLENNTQEIKEKLRIIRTGMEEMEQKISCLQTKVIWVAQLRKMPIRISWDLNMQDLLKQYKMAKDKNHKGRRRRNPVKGIENFSENCRAKCAKCKEMMCQSMFKKNAEHHVSQG